MNLKKHLVSILAKEDLSGDDARAVFEAIAEGKVEPVQIAGLLVALSAKGETVEEIAGIAKAFLAHAVPVKVEGEVMDVCGTGGDGHDTANISTAASILAAACGAKIAKHGNRSVSSCCGSADVLEALGIPLLPFPEVMDSLNAANITFLYAPLFHPAMQHVGPVRKTLGVRTVFNIMGPLVNPARAAHVVCGVYKAELMEPMARVFQCLGARRGLVVHCCGLDELAPIGVADAVEICGASELKKLRIDHSDFGIPRCQISDLKGGHDAQSSADILLKVFSGGAEADTPLGQTIALNAGAALYVYGLADSIGEGYSKASGALREGKAMATLKRWVDAAAPLRN